MDMLWLLVRLGICLWVSFSNASTKFQEGLPVPFTGNPTLRKFPPASMGDYENLEGSNGSEVKMRRKVAPNVNYDCRAPGSPCSSVKTLDQIYLALHRIVEMHSDVAKLSVIGETFKGNPIYVMEIHSGSAFYYEIVTVDFGLHSREWAGPTSALYLIESLIAQGGEMVEKIQWFIIPVANPDGYGYSTSVNHFWRKNLRPINGSKCLGVDVNRNFEVGWETSLSADPCREDYSGSEPFSEHEARAIRDFIEAIDPQYVDAYVSVHACLQSIFYPYEYTEEEPPADLLKDMIEVGAKMAAAMSQVRNSSYYVGTNSDFFLGGGVVGDFMFGQFHIPLVFRLELGDLAYYKNQDYHQCYHPAKATMEALTKECFLGLTALANHLIETRAPFRNKITTMKTPAGKRILTSPSSAHGNSRLRLKTLVALVALQGHQLATQ